MREDVRTLFHRLADVPRAQREQYYSSAAVPAAIQTEVESLIGFDDLASDSLGGLIGSAAEQFLLANAPVQENGRCGPYRLVQLLGNGGMGAVYLGERADGELDQRVAIKVLRYGFDQSSFRDRFLRERQILASLNHPGIAHLIDAGHAGGHPYLVMEHVNGTRIDEFVSGLDMRGILMLFLHVCDAVSYAHRNLIIHRDLKPSNILIDANGEPKLLDFGIAKILNVPEETQTVDRLLTPEYASPEQMRGDAQATTTDIYSLGAVLYKLLTGERPNGDITTRALPKDLDSILRKAMRTEPEERYASVDGFSDDLRAFLEHRPVRARTGNAWYAMRMFVRRYRLPVAAAALALTGLVGGLIVADRARGVAERRFQQVRQLSNKLLELDAEIRNLPGATQARHRIVAASLEYLERLGAEARPTRWSVANEQDLELALEIGNAYLQVARVQGVPIQPNLGQSAQAKESLSKADLFIEPVLASTSFSQRRNALLVSAEIAQDSMILAENDNRDADALAFGQKAAGRLETMLGAAGSTREESKIVARLYSNIALAHSNMHRVDEAARYARRAVETARPLGDDRILSASLSVFSNAARFSGDLESALKASREARSIAEKVIDPNNASITLNLAAALWREGLILGELNNINLDRGHEAIPLIQKALELAEGLAQRDAHDNDSRAYVGMAGRELGDILRDNDAARALNVYDSAFRRLAEVNSTKSRRDQVWLLAGSSYSLRRLGRPADAKKRIDDAFAILKDVKDYPAATVELGDIVDATLRALADHQADSGAMDAAIATYQELFEKVRASSPQPETDLRHANGLSRIYRDLGNLYRRAGRASEADTLHKQRLELWQSWDKKLPDNPFVQRQLSAARST